MKTENSINFKVVSIVPSNLHEDSKLTWVTLTIETNERITQHERRSYKNLTYFDGCKITFDEKTYECIKVVRQYETKNSPKKSSIAKQSKEIEEQEQEEQEQIKDDEEKLEKEVHHEKYEEIKMCLVNDIPVYLAGPAGSGKNHTIEQIAKELDWNFYFSNSVQQEFKLTGFIDAGGKFHETEFYKACTDEKECVFFLDEMDASIPEVLVLLNAAIANGYFEFPNGIVRFNKVHFIAAGNTLGSGANETYNGRMVLDQATLDRFAIIEFDYSEIIEKAITNNNSELIDFIHMLRRETQNQGIRATFSYRCMTMVTKLENSGMELTTILKIAVVKGLDKDTINTIFADGHSKYSKALRQIQKAA